jgi:hypothetical protein
MSSVYVLSVVLTPILCEDTRKKEWASSRRSLKRKAKSALCNVHVPAIVALKPLVRPYSQSNEQEPAAPERAPSPFVFGYNDCETQGGPK